MEEVLETTPLIPDYLEQLIEQHDIRVRCVNQLELLQLFYNDKRTSIHYSKLNNRAVVEEKVDELVRA